MQCIVACLHVKLDRLESTQGAEGVSCGVDLGNSLLVLSDGGAIEKRQEATDDSERTLVTVEAFLRKVRTTMERNIHIAIRPKVLLLCVAACHEGSSSSTRRSSIGSSSTCHSCGADQDAHASVTCNCSCGCCWGCETCRPEKQSLEGLARLLDDKGCGACGCKESQGHACREGNCKRCCFLFYADINGDAYVPLNKSSFDDFVRDCYPEFGV